LRGTEPFALSFRGARGGLGAEWFLKKENNTLVAESMEDAADVRVWSAEVSAVGLEEDGRGCGIGERPLDAVQGEEVKNVVCYQDPDDDDMVGWITRASHSFDDGAFIPLAPYGSPSHSQRDTSLPPCNGGEGSERVETQNSAYGKGLQTSVVQFDLTTTQDSQTATTNATAPPTSPTGGMPLAAAQGAAEGSADVVTPKGAPTKNSDALLDTNSDTDSDVQVLDVSGCSLGAHTCQVEDAVSVSLSMPASHPPAPPSGRTVASLITTPARQREESGWVSANAHLVPGSGSRSVAVAGDSSLKLSTPASALRCMSLSVYAQRLCACACVFVSICADFLKVTRVMGSGASTLGRVDLTLASAHRDSPGATSRPLRPQNRLSSCLLWQALRENAKGRERTRARESAREGAR
jgi:hypothetical protein